MPKSLTDLAEIMRDIDFTMLSTKTADGGIAARPMSNNRDVDYDGDSYFFALDSTHTVQEIQADPNVGLTLHGNKGLLGKPPIFIAAEGKAEIIRDKAAFEAHWVKDLERWFEQGTDTPGLVLIKVHADRIHYWDGEDQGEITFA
ncbi:pyridoxamine 5'-phosphate oxidase family protein [uncultured Sphingomonas sp.]|uniref:pyridoxamine 5'-phosphate oxidase family protein n=1 Tax=uncultured Sphingomonas sp. TaxID=158754 RepID=UPI0025D9508A|nr:pyridoxamine 5'-phosphate oxidase family protein [uncultured Sphingomonas sp.]